MAAGISDAPTLGGDSARSADWALRFCGASVGAEHAPRPDPCYSALDRSWARLPSDLQAKQKKTPLAKLIRKEGHTSRVPSRFRWNGHRTIAEASLVGLTPSIPSTSPRVKPITNSPLHRTPHAGNRRSLNGQRGRVERCLKVVEGDPLSSPRGAF
jgi:hypothetical protein